MIRIKHFEESPLRRGSNKPCTGNGLLLETHVTDINMILSILLIRKQSTLVVQLYLTVVDGG